MEVDFMEQRALYRNSILFLLLAVLVRCGAQQPDLVEQLPLFDATVHPCRDSNGFTYMQGLPFTGVLYQLHSGSNDTAQIRSYVNGKPHGIWKQFYTNGQQQFSRSFYHGNKTGIYTRWWENGRKQLQYAFLNDEYKGACYEWNREGVLIKAMHYHAGHETGSQKLFYDNGKVRANYTIINGRRFGLLGTKNCMNVSEKVFD